MSEFFGDELSEVRQRTYWRLLAPICTLQEWETVCLEAMGGETFHKVPLPAVLQGYLTRLRQARARETSRARLSHQRALEASPEWRAADRAMALATLAADEARLTQQKEAVMVLTPSSPSAFRRHTQDELRAQLLSLCDRQKGQTWHA
jgi:hypothetical protein